MNPVQHSMMPAVSADTLMIKKCFTALC